ncbi:MAG: transporter substrate-binding domain-containing protein [Candidatus Magnetoovum sp. WYHC-5]|nr:transporter substrate-binding domain-containing protein [Candidatus Magnetoovum sp. WYHC-5]
MRLTVLTMFIFTLFFSAVVFGEQQQTLVLNTAYSAPITSADKTGFLDLIYKDLSRRLGINIIINYLPAERALKNANSGIDDGDIGRIVNINATGEYPNLVRVPEHIMQLQIMVFTSKPNVVVKTPEDLRPYDVGIITGWKIAERNTTKAHSITKVEEVKQLFTMLEKGRIDIALIERMIGMKLLKDSGIKNVRMSSTPLIEEHFYLYLNKKHKALVPKFVDAIKAMKADGTYERIFFETIGCYTF